MISGGSNNNSASFLIDKRQVFDMGWDEKRTLSSTSSDGPTVHHQEARLPGLRAIPKTQRISDQLLLGGKKQYKAELPQSCRERLQPSCWAISSLTGCPTAGSGSFRSPRPLTLLCCLSTGTLHHLIPATLPLLEGCPTTPFSFTPGQINGKSSIPESLEHDTCA